MRLKSFASLKLLSNEAGSVTRLTLLERLGLGPQAEVWLARDQLLGRLVTVKKVTAFEDGEGNQGDERIKSLRARVEVDHPAIPTLFGAIPHGDQSWLVSEYVEGVPLSQLVGELSPESICAIAKDLLSALRCLECLSLVHGDLSPNNVVIDLNGQVRLLDFESCSRVGEALSSSATIGFSAPERHAKRAGLPTVDTWSVGAILIWLVTQRTPEVVVDDARQPVSVSIGNAAPAADMLGDVINIAAAATRLDPSLRPCAADLEDRLSRSYRWLEPINRSVLSALVSSRLASDGEEVAVNSELDGDKPGRTRRLRTLLLLPALCLLSALSLFSLSWEERAYSLHVDTTRLSPATLLPETFSPRWVGAVFSKGLPPRWTSLENEVVAPQVPSDGVSVIAVNVNCQQGVCELLTEHARGSKRALGHTVIVDTSDERIWRAAITNLAQSIAAD
jgi:serine/threonine protein kinase